MHDDLYREITPFGEGKLNRTKLSRKDIGTQIPTATVNTSTTGSWYYQSETYGGQFTINDKGSHRCAGRTDHCLWYD